RPALLLLFPEVAQSGPGGCAQSTVRPSGIVVDEDESVQYRLGPERGWFPVLRVKGKERIVTGGRVGDNPSPILHPFLQVVDQPLLANACCRLAELFAQGRTGQGERHGRV